MKYLQNQKTMKLFEVRVNASHFLLILGNDLPMHPTIHFSASVSAFSNPPSASILVQLNPLPPVCGLSCPRYTYQLATLMCIESNVCIPRTMEVLTISMCWTQETRIHDLLCSILRKPLINHPIEFHLCLS